MYLIYIRILTSNRRAFCTSGSNSACILYSIPGSWVRGLNFLARSPLPRFMTAFSIFHFRFFIYHTYLVIYYSSSFSFKHLIFCGHLFPDSYIYLHWQTCISVGQEEKMSAQTKLVSNEQHIHFKPHTTV